MDYDVIIIGAGPAGLTAAIYAARYKLNFIVVTKDIGGLAATAHKICNYPSYDVISGYELMQKILAQAENLGAKIDYQDVTSIVKEGDGYKVISPNAEYTARKIIFTGGTAHQTLNIPGEASLVGRGVSYCATCDGAFFKNKKVAVVGGSDAALTAALLLAEYAGEVYIIYRGEKFVRSEPAWVELVEKEKKIKSMFGEEITRINGSSRVESVTLKSGGELAVDGVFVEIGSKPSLAMISTLHIEREGNYIAVNKRQQTNVKGFYAAGDVTNGVLKQIVTAAAQGAIAAQQVYGELKRESAIESEIKQENI